MTLIFVLLLMLFFLAWLIKYPDIIQGQAMLTTPIPPVKLVSQTNGTIEKIYPADNTSVEQGALIATITNPVSEEALASLQAFLKEVQAALAGKTNQAQQLMVLLNEHTLGDMQVEYNDLRKLFQDYLVLTKSGHYAQRVQALSAQLQNSKRLATILEQQHACLAKTLANEKEKYDAYQQLYTRGAMAKMELLDKEVHYLALQQALADQDKAIVQNKIALKERELELKTLTFEHTEKERTLKTPMYASVQRLRNEIHQWQQHYTLRAPFAGTIIHLHTFSKEQFVQQGEALFALVPQEELPIVQAQLPAQGYGKIRPGQKARIKLAPYPYQEYGYLAATVKEVALLPKQAQYEATLHFNEGLVTVYGKTLPFKPEMRGWVEIITEDRNLLQRITHKILGLSNSPKQGHL